MSRKNSAVNVALIGLMGAAVGGGLANWDKLFPERGKTETEEVLAQETRAREALALAETAKAQAEAERIRMELERQQREAEEERKRQEALRIQTEAEERARSIAAEVAPKIIEAYWLGGTHISAEVGEVVYDSEQNTYRIDVDLNWFGMFNSSNRYWAEGVIHVDKEGQLSFVKTAASGDLQQVEQAVQGIKLGIALNELSESASGGATQ